MDFEKIKGLPYMSKRMYVIKNICIKRNIDLEYLFGLFNLYNNKNSGKWFWQKASFTGALKSAYDGFNKVVDDIVKKIKKTDEAGFFLLIEEAVEPLDRLLMGMEASSEVNRDNDYEYVKGFLDNNLRALIKDSLRPLGQENEV